ncbi:MAG: glycine betaine ABC transporter substrate-binding protein [Xenococcaceae cyanobacterium MO_188.B29]|nr:glycine betaine ABC transporter substrate-binding protein [Xenococcaceae cyanobacterium MO_188.B29]
MFLTRYTSEILQYTGEHLILVIISISVAIAIGIPLGILITRQPNLAKPILAIANAIQTIPSLAIFGFLISVPFLGGIGKIPAIVALSLYALLPLIRNTYTGIKSVDPAIIEAGRGMGMSDRQLLWQVEIPLALGIILAGVRVATVICVGIATIAAAIGGGGLGVLIFRGIATVNNELILAGAIPAAIIALGADLLLSWLEASLDTKKTTGKLSIWQWTLPLGIILLILLSTIFWQQTALVSNSNDKIIIGSKNFTEQIILGELLAQQIEKETNLQVDRRFNLGGSFIAHEAVKAGEIDGYVEYTGTAFTAILQQKVITDPQIVYQRVKQAYADKFNLVVLDSLGFENTFAIVIRGEDAQKYKLKTISEAAKYTPQWQAGFGHEFLAREDGYPGLAKTYGLQFARSPKGMEIGLMYKALSTKQVDLVAGNSTDGLIPILNLVVLEDNKKYFPPYEAVPIFNQQTLTKYPQVKEAIDQLAGTVSADTMQQMNYQVDEQALPVEEVVRKFLAD